VCSSDLDAAEAAAIAAAATDTDTDVAEALAAAEAYTDTKLAGIDLPELVELSSEIGMLDDTVSANPAAASFDLSDVVPAGAVIIGVQVKLMTAITGADGATKVGIGTAAVPDKYGKTTGLTSGLLITTTPNWAVLGAPETINLYAVDDAGAATGKIGGASESIKVRVMYTQIALL
jgi:hypothetical protein